VDHGVQGFGSELEPASPIVTTRFDLPSKETMAHETSIQKQMQRIGEIVEKLESTVDPSARAMAKELLESLMALHGAALEQILEFAANAGEAGETIIRNCGRDELVGSVLLLYGLHPESLRTRVLHALEKTRKSLQSNSASAELVSVSDDGTVTVRLEGKPSGCGSSAAKAGLEAALQNAAPDAASIIVQEAGSGLTGSGFISLSQLRSGQSLAVLSGARSPQGD
jgi:Fe-S cluster biogenesis protein NfuA